MKDKKVVITGLGIVSPLGIGISEYWRNLLKNKSPLKQAKFSSTKEFDSIYSFQIQGFNFNRFFKDLKSEYIPRSTKFVLVAAKIALKDASLFNRDFYRSEDTGVFTSTVYGSSDASYGFFLDILLKGPDKVDPMAFPPTLINYSSNYLSIINNFKGPNLTFSSGFHAGLEAINFASNLIKQGIIKVALVSGLNDLCVYSYAQLSLKGFLFEPKGKKKYRTGIFAPARNGFILGENASTIILEDIENARKRGARIYAEVSGYSTNFGKNENCYCRVGKEAMDNAGLSVNEIRLCMLNSNGMKAIDLMELKAVKTLFKDNLDKVDFMAIKENNGECEGAASILQALTAAKAIYCKTMPLKPYRYIKPGKIAKINSGYKAGKKGIANVLINVFNPEGNNAALVMKKVD